METLPAILVVDNNPIILQEIEIILGKNYSVYKTESPYVALDLIKKGNRFSAILYNYCMPSMSGNIFFGRVRNITVATRILLAANTRTDYLISALNQGGISFFIAKPLDPLSVCEVVERAVLRSEYRRQLRHEQLLLKGLLDHLPYGVAFKDEQGKFTRMNELAASRRGRSVEECLGKTEEEIEPSFKPEELKQFQNRLLKEECFVATLEVPSNEINSPSRWFLITRLLLGRARGEITRPSVIMELDISDQKNWEAKLQQAEKLHALGTMAGSIAHDFNNLLTTISGSIELCAAFLLKSDPKSEFKKEYIERLLENALSASQKGSLMTERLLSFSRRKKMSIQNVDIFKVIKDYQDLLSQTLSMRLYSRRNEIECVTRKPQLTLAIADYKGKKTFVKTDPSQLELAIMNLCINSVDAMPEGGEIKITFKNVKIDDRNDLKHLEKGWYVVVTVKDNGQGMSTEIIDHIFEPFFTTKEVGWGTGLGLAMVYGFAQQSGGDVLVKSQLGQGTAISIYLPAFSQKNCLDSTK
ncbi:Sensor histidine kinase RcsC [Commensalibacter sp. Nvir]|uniref:ATP-binding response regulator n=1 Tax=Commensalibacter sp. Nvir TaxID=3069817 RepID=UPI002D4A7BB8|nr:Sensor histidine kinase RcsC [Commensalibacter sp. Nvir]